MQVLPIVCTVIALLSFDVQTQRFDLVAEQDDARARNALVTSPETMSSVLDTISNVSNYVENSHPINRIARNTSSSSSSFNRSHLALADVDPVDVGGGVDDAQRGAERARNVAHQHALADARWTMKQDACGTRRCVRESERGSAIMRERGEDKRLLTSNCFDADRFERRRHSQALFDQLEQRSSNVIETDKLYIFIAIVVGGDHRQVIIVVRRCSCSRCCHRRRSCHSFLCNKHCFDSSHRLNEINIGLDSLLMVVGSNTVRRCDRNYLNTLDDSLYQAGQLHVNYCYVSVVTNRAAFTNILP